MDAGFFRGTSADQDNRFSNKQKKLMKEMKFAEGLEKKVDMTKVNLETIKPWITQKITQMLSFEDDVVIEFVFNQLDDKHPDGRLMQINLTGFLNGKNARVFMGELWPLLLSAQENIAGIPLVFLEQKKEEIKQRQLEQEKLALLQSKEEEEERKAKERFSSRKRSFTRSRSQSRSRSRSRGRHRHSSSPSPQASPIPVPPPSNELPPVDHSEKSVFLIGQPTLTQPNIAVGSELLGTSHQSPLVIPDQSAKPQSESPLPEVTSTTSVKVDGHSGGPIVVAESKEVVVQEKSQEKERKKPRHHSHSHSHSRSRSRSRRRRHRSRSRSRSRHRGSPRRRRVSPRHRSPPRYHSTHRQSPRRYRRPISHGRSHRRTARSPPPLRRRRRSRSPSHSPSSSRSPRRRQEKRRSLSAPHSVSPKELISIPKAGPVGNASPSKSESSASNEDRKGANLTSVQQRRRYRRQNQESSSEVDSSSSSSSEEDEEVKPRAPKNIARSERPHVRQRSQSHSPSPRHHARPTSPRWSGGWRGNSPSRRRPPQPPPHRRSSHSHSHQKSPSPPHRRRNSPTWHRASPNRRRHRGSPLPAPRQRPSPSRRQPLRASPSPPPPRQRHRSPSPSQSPSPTPPQKIRRRQPSASSESPPHAMKRPTCPVSVSPRPKPRPTRVSSSSPSPVRPVLAPTKRSRSSRSPLDLPRAASRSASPLPRPLLPVATFRDRSPSVSPSRPRKLSPPRPLLPNKSPSPIRLSRSAEHISPVGKAPSQSPYQSPSHVLPLVQASRSPSPAKVSDAGSKKKKKKKEKKHKREKKHKKHKKHKKSRTAEVESESEGDGGNLDDLEKQLREKALRSMRKSASEVQALSPSP